MINKQNKILKFKINSYKHLSMINTFYFDLFVDNSFFILLFFFLTNYLESILNSFLFLLFLFLFLILLLVLFCFGFLLFLILVVCDFGDSDDSAELESDCVTDFIDKLHTLGNGFFLVVDFFQRFPLKWANFGDSTFQYIISKFPNIFDILNFARSFMHNREGFK